jgi:hypothetical protein
MKSKQNQNSCTQLYKVGIGIPPNININNIITIMPATISGIRKRKTAKIMIAIAAISISVSVDPSYGNISIIPACIINAKRNQGIEHRAS